MTDDSSGARSRLPSTDEIRTHRRALIAGAAAVLGGGALATLGAGGSDPIGSPVEDEDLVRYHEIRGQEGRDAALAYLDGQAGIDAVATHQAMAFGSDGRGLLDAGIDAVRGNEDECDVCLDWTFARIATGSDPYYYAEMAWWYDDENWWGEGGYLPVDAGGIYFDHDRWRFYDRDSLSGTTTSSDEVGVSDADIHHGLGFTIDDRSGCGCAPEEREYFGVKLVPFGDDPPEDRWVAGEYVHTWGTGPAHVNLNISTTGVSIDVSGTDERVKTTSSGDAVNVGEDQPMRSAQSDVL